MVNRNDFWFERGLKSDDGREEASWRRHERRSFTGDFYGPALTFIGNQLVIGAFSLCWVPAEKSVLLTGASQAEWFCMKAKIALAVGVIKSRPPGMSGREHAEALACRLQSQEESWKDRAQRLQQEVLRLRQELLLTRVTSDAKSSTETAGCDSTMDDVSQDLFGSGSVLHSTEPQLNSDSETPELFLQDPQSAITPPSPTTHSSFPAGPLHPHVQFLQALCALQRVGGNSRSLEALWFSPGGDAGSVLVDSVCQLLDSVVTVFRDPSSLGPRDFVLQACQVAGQAMDLLCSERLPTVELKRRVEESLKELTGMLLHSDQPSGLEAAEKLMECLITLGSGTMSKSFLIRHVLSHISALADRLWQASQVQDSSGLDQFPVDQYQNACRLFWILEELVQKSKVPCGAHVGSEQMGFLTDLEQRVFLLSDEFPLFSIGMWRIRGLLTSPDSQDPARCK
ncbi:meiosis-specific protein MEI4 [Mastacembelus armatus]|uniref:meiosis-specific protein MEI4 n=1 Tax=Mastacembelus armatus TaxID=205130 RepID=UPI000E45E7BE|nr:meiosis-specific protein MEI4-like [Mastacembelus armatus]